MTYTRILTLSQICRRHLQGGCRYFPLDCRFPRCSYSNQRQRSCGNNIRCVSTLSISPEARTLNNLTVSGIALYNYLKYRQFTNSNSDKLKSSQAAQGERDTAEESQFEIGEEETPMLGRERDGYTSSVRRFCYPCRTNSLTELHFPNRSRFDLALVTLWSLSTRSAATRPHLRDPRFLSTHSLLNSASQLSIL